MDKREFYRGMPMVTIVILLAAGIAVGFVMKQKDTAIQYADYLLNLSICLLLFLLGISVGINETIVTNIHTIGLEALILTVAAVVGSIAVSYVVSKVFFGEP